MKRFTIRSDVSGRVTEFTEDTAPHWLRFGGRQGSTADNRWFWDAHVCTLKVGESVDTDFSTITRIA